MKDQKIIMAGLANNKTSLGEVFRRYVECFKTFSKPDVFDLQPFTKNDEFKLDLFPQYKGPINHDVKYFHSTFNLYRAIKEKTKQIPRSSSVKKIGYFVWESSELHSKDSEVLKDFDEIWTASNYCKDIFSQYIDSDKIFIINHPLNQPSKKYKKFKKFTILVMGSLMSSDERKNISTNLKAASIIQQKNPEVDIVFKTWSTSDWERDEIKKLSTLGNVRVIDEFYEPRKVEELISKCHVILSLHRSEGFGLTLAEAIINNTIPVCTGYSGNTDYLSTTNLLVDYKLVPVNNPFFKGEWAEPNFDDAVDKIQNVLGNFDNELELLQKSKQNLLQNNNNFSVSHEIKKQIYSDMDWSNNSTELVLHPNSLDKEYKGGLFNPAFIKSKNKNYLLCRAETVQELYRKNLFMGKLNPVLVELDKDLKTIKNYKEINIENDEENIKLEDFRSFYYNNNTLISCTYINKNIKTAICELDLKNKKIEKIHIPNLLNFQTDKTEKNWAYFEKEGELYLIYSMNPYILFKKTTDFNFEKVFEIDYNILFSGYNISNSINPFIYNDYYFHIVHVNTGKKTYKHYPILLNKDTLKPEYYSDTPMFEKYNCYGSYNRVLYLTDYNINKDEITFFFGEGDACVSKKTILLDDLKNISWKKYE
jgi:predicted GH43/DUF377 family glycosyl hydrolase